MCPRCQDPKCDCACTFHAGRERMCFMHVDGCASVCDTSAITKSKPLPPLPAKLHGPGRAGAGRIYTGKPQRRPRIYDWNDGKVKSGISP